jgi:hypothetical protein
MLVTMKKGVTCLILNDCSIFLPFGKPVVKIVVLLCKNLLS